MGSSKEHSPGLGQADPGKCGETDLDACRALVPTCAAYNLRRASRLVTQAFDAELRPIGLKTTQFSLLVASRINENLILHKLARVMGMDRTTLSRNLRLLEKMGLVDMEKGDDQREVKVRVTGQGQKILDQAVPLWQKAQDRVTGIVGQETWAGMLGDIRALTAGLKSKPAT